MTNLSKKEFCVVYVKLNDLEKHNFFEYRLENEHSCF